MLEDAFPTTFPSGEGSDLAGRVLVPADQADGRVTIPIAATYPLDQVREAYTELAKGHTGGKIVLLP